MDSACILTLRKFVASTMRTWLLTTCALALALVCSAMPLVCVFHLYNWLRLRLGGGVGGLVPVAVPDSVHSTCIELQLSLATTSWLRLRVRLRLGGGEGGSVPVATV